MKGKSVVSVDSVETKRIRKCGQHNFRCVYVCYHSVRIYDFDSVYVYVHSVTLSFNKQPATFIVTYHLNFLFENMYILSPFHSPSDQDLKLRAMPITQRCTLALSLSNETVDLFPFFSGLNNLC